MKIENYVLKVTEVYKQTQGDEKSFGVDQEETRYSRTMPVPGDVILSNIKAKYVDGTLIGTLPRDVKYQVREPINIPVE